MYPIKRVVKSNDDDEYTRRTQSTCGCYGIELSCNETIVLSFNFVADRAGRNARYCHLFVTSVLVRNSKLVNFITNSFRRPKTSLLIVLRNVSKNENVPTCNVCRPVLTVQRVNEREDV